MGYDVLVLGSLVMDRKYFATGTLGGTAPVWDVQRHHGGVGRNIAVNTARLGARTAFAGLSGHGRDAAELEAELTALGVRPLHVLRTPDGIGRWDVLLDADGQQITSRIALPDPAAARPLAGPALAATVAAAGAVLAEGGLDEDLLTWLSREAGKGGTLMCCLPTRQRDFGPRAHLLPLYDVLLLNAREALALTGEAGTPAEQARRLLGHGPRVVVVTAGADGAAVASAEEPTALALPAETGPCTDDTGAGDALASAFVVHLVRGASPRAALALGLRAARLTIGCGQSTCRTLATDPALTARRTGRWTPPGARAS
ncbi:carbohydrate kinase family protein [Streptomyces lanatus]|uniref:PfkB family carbohydrate kinase n=1 Tax=Streptomyces lanatus TaxID=66900 RepID=A0ABV1XHX1_9ACTN|nr:PfkB family carbohydrate kinase [Streptomyces lanatus]GHG93772.1 carbohydrate kinase [Streptomyces lanatus]